MSMTMQKLQRIYIPIDLIPNISMETLNGQKKLLIMSRKKLLEMLFIRLLICQKSFIQTVL